MNLNYIKMAKVVKSNKEDSYRNAKGVAGIGAGAYVGKKSIPRLTGRTVLYHGTDSDSAKSILSEGLIGGKKKGLTHQVLGDKVHNLNLAYTTPSKLIGGLYAVNNSNIRGGKGKVLKAKVPLWKMEDKLVQNPELYGAKTQKEWAGKAVDNAVKRNLLSSEDAKKTTKILEGPIGRLTRRSYKKSKVFKDKLGPEYFAKSDKYKRLGIKELKEYIKARPGKFGKGVAMAVGAAGLGAYGINKLVGSSKKS